jgi:hypothetical protein
MAQKMAVELLQVVLSFSECLAQGNAIRQKPLLLAEGSQPTLASGTKI